VIGCLCSKKYSIIYSLNFNSNINDWNRIGGLLNTGKLTTSNPKTGEKPSPETSYLSNMPETVDNTEDIVSGCSDFYFIGGRFESGSGHRLF
jgi:hypothetical protein